VPIPTNLHTLAYVSIRQHTSAYVNIRQHTSDHTPQPGKQRLRCHDLCSCTSKASKLSGKRSPPRPSASPSEVTAYVGIRQHTSAYVSVCERAHRHGHLRVHRLELLLLHGLREPEGRAYVSIRQHTSAYGSIRQHTAAYVNGPEGLSLALARLLLHRLRFFLCIRQHTSAYVSIRSSAYVSIRQHTLARLRPHRLCFFLCMSQHPSAYVSYISRL
jgi:hypothetical protein